MILIALSSLALGFGWASNHWRNSANEEQIERQIIERWQSLGGRATVVDGTVRTLRLTSDESFKYLAECKEIETLITEVGITGSSVTDLGIANLKLIDSVHEIILSDSQVTDDGLRALANLSNIKSLGLNGTTISDAGLVHLRPLRSLTCLDLGNTKITDKGLYHLGELEKLESLYLFGCQVSDSAVDRLRARLPNCFIPD